MNKGYVLVVLVAVLVLVEGKTQLKRRNGSKAAANVDRVIESRGGEELLQENSLKAGDKFLDVYQALLQKKAARDAVSLYSRVYYSPIPKLLHKPPA